MRIGSGGDEDGELFPGLEIALYQSWKNFRIPITQHAIPTDLQTTRVFTFLHVQISQEIINFAMKPNSGRIKDKGNRESYCHLAVFVMRSYIREVIDDVMEEGNGRLWC